MAPVLVAQLPLLRNWNTPVDFGFRFQGERVLGDNKTWRGFVFGILAAIVTTVLIFWVLQNFPTSSIISLNFLNSNPIFLGFLLGAGALVGDSVKSFFKRRQKIQSGKSWFPFDQLDYIVGAILFTILYVPLRPVEYLEMLVLGFVLHIATVYIGYLTKIREQAI